MAFTPGTRLGIYEITAPIGEGGMGQVFRARDTKLDRAVAIKILPEAFARDPERLARFRREAKTLASLNHPHIAGIYGLEESGGMTALVLELVEGEDLSQRIARGAIPIDEALPVATQIAEALEAAHEQGIIHRDLKPANIKVRPDGSVKVLDFGLAKALDQTTPSSPSVTDSPTITTPAMTQGGLILGTAAYMSPEQARGKIVDTRADIWAFGVVLFEMLTGRRPFEGHDTSITLAAVVLKEPAWQALPPETPLGVRRLLRRCLQKDSTRRLRDIGDARLELDDPLTTSVDLPTHPRVRSWTTVAWVMGAAAFASIATGAAMWGTIRPTPTSAAGVLRFRIASQPEIHYNGGELALSPDGTEVVYPAFDVRQKLQRLYALRLNQFDPTPIAGTDGATGPFFSPDGGWVGFVAGGRLMKTAVRGEEVPISICDVSSLLGTSSAGLQGATWGPDNTIVFGAGTLGNAGLYRVSGTGGAPTILTQPDAAKHERRHAWPSFVLQGQAILFSILPAGQVTFTNAQTAVLSLKTGHYAVLLEHGYHARYVPGGYLVYTQQDQEGAVALGSGDTLMAVPFDAGKLTITGPAVPVVQRIQGEGISGGSYYDVSPTGALVYAPATASSNARRALVWVDRQGREESLELPPRAYVYPRISPDGRRVAVAVADAGIDIWIWEISHRNLTRLTLGSGNRALPAWTRDGSRIAFASRAAIGNAPYNVFWQAADGTGSAERLGPESPTAQFPYQFTADDRQLLVQDSDPAGTAVRVLSVSGHQAEPLLSGPFNQRDAVLSPDQHWLAYTSNESGRDEVYVRPFPNVRAGRVQVSTNGGAGPRWAPSGKELFYLNTLNAAPDVLHVMAVPISFSPALSADPPAELFSGNYIDFLGLNYDISPDGRRFLMVRDATDLRAATTPPAGISVVSNWVEELKHREPPK